MTQHTLVTVELDQNRSYPIFIGQSLLNQREKFAPYIKGKQVCIVTNETIAPKYLDQLKATLGDEYQIDSVILPDGEAYKTQEQLMPIYDCLLSNNHNRTTTLIALGGGVIGDMTGYAAASYQRGVNFIQVPTTLLAQVDSSVGGKTGVNHPLGKNMIGAFYQPQAVIIDIDVLTSLPASEISAGLAEVIKYGLIIDVEFYNWLETHIDALVTLQPDSIIQAIARSCECKAYVVNQDEREAGLRAILNLGHTFGHAIETHEGYGQWLHGEAVAAGMVAALELSAQQGWIEQEEVSRLIHLLEKCQLPVKLPQHMSNEDFLKHMIRDKKVTDGRLRLVALETIGKAKVVSDLNAQQITSAIEECR